MILAKVDSKEWPEDRLQTAMDQFLERESDRELFGLGKKGVVSSDNNAPE